MHNASVCSAAPFLFQRDDIMARYIYICKSAKWAVVNFAKTVCSSLTQGLELNKREVTEDLAYYDGLKYLSYIYWVETESFETALTSDHTVLPAGLCHKNDKPNSYNVAAYIPSHHEMSLNHKWLLLIAAVLKLHLFFFVFSFSSLTLAAQ